MQPVLLGHSFFRPFLSFSLTLSLSLSPLSISIFLPLTLAFALSLCVYSAVWMSFSCSFSPTVDWKMLSSSVTKEAVH